MHQYFQISNLLFIIYLVIFINIFICLYLKMKNVDCFPFPNFYFHYKHTS